MRWHREHRSELAPRDREILKDVIYTFITSGEAVSSRTVAKHGRLQLSPATIRNVMADLEDMGYLAQPHSSAGRVPTSSGYHLYIEHLVRMRRLPSRTRHYIQDHLERAPADGEGRTVAATQLLSELSQQVAVVLTPALAETVLRSVEFVALSGARVLCVVVSESGFIDNKVIETAEPLPRSELVRISNYLTESFAGSTMGEIRDRLLAAMEDERAQVDRLLRLSVELAQKGLVDGNEPGLLVEGAATVLSQPELANLDRIRRLFDTFAEKARLVRILNQCLAGQGVRVLIGDDSELTSELDFSLVATTYQFGDRRLGSLGVFGPSRMDYERLIPLVEFLGETLSAALATTFEGRRTEDS